MGGSCAQEFICICRGQIRSGDMNLTVIRHWEEHKLVKSHRNGRQVKGLNQKLAPGVCVCVCVCMCVCVCVCVCAWVCACV